MTSKQRAYLRGLANTLEPIVHVGKDGVNDNMIKQLSDALEARELVKGTVLQNSPMTAREAIAALCEGAGAE
ncbi:MAG: YhbY family RNA-binding protein, partial [Candidatus Ventricola sp.]